MSEISPIRYYDRHSATLAEERVYAGGFLFWSYNTRIGRLLTALVLRQPLLSTLYGWLNKQRWSKRRIEPFATAMGINVEESVKPLSEFSSFNDFFIREIRLSRRPINHDPAVCITPADGKVLVLPSVERGRTFRIKGGVFTLEPFLGSTELAHRFTGGAMIIIRLHLSDYHHFHFPVAGVPGRAKDIPGKLYAVAPYARRWPVPFYTENRRMVTLIRSDQFGEVAMVEIGAFTVGSIRQQYLPGIHVAKGTHKGYFELGGSTVVLLFRPGVIRLDEDLCVWSRTQVETYVHLGESIGGQ